MMERKQLIGFRVARGRVPFKQARYLFLHGPPGGRIERRNKRNVILVRESDFIVIEDCDEASGSLRARGGQSAVRPAGFVKEIGRASWRQRGGNYVKITG